MKTKNFDLKTKGDLMKKTMILTLVLLCAALLIPGVQAAATLKATISNYEPSPASPGGTVKVWVLLQNVGDEDAKNINVEVIPEFPFSIYGDSAVKKISVLGQNKDYLIDFNMKIDDGAVQGYNTIKVRMGEEGKSQSEATLKIYVQAKDATLAIESVKIDPETIIPGSNGKVQITVKNTAPVVLTDITMKLVLQSVVGSSVVDLPFAPVDSSAEKKIYKINPGEEATFEYTLKAYPDAVSKVYKIPFTLEYYDSLNAKKNVTSVIGIIVNSKPDVVALLDKTDLSQQKRAGAVVLNIVNKGLSDIKFLTVSVKQGEGYQLLSDSTENYIGNLDSDDFQTIEYSINADKSLTEVSIPVTIEYMDANNNKYVETQTVVIPLHDEKALQAATTSGSSTWMIVIVVIIIAGAGYWFFKRSKKSKKGQFN